MFKIVIFTSDPAVFAERKAELAGLTVPAQNIIWCDSLKQTRAEFISHHVGIWMLFLDHDCFVNSETLRKIADLIREQPQPGNIVFSGRYLNSEGAGYLQRGHNFIANTWLEQSYAFGSQNCLILGGVFLIHCLREPVFSKQGRFWGAEDKMLSYELNQQGFSIQFSEAFSVRHETTGSLKHFLKRAYLHGKNEVKYCRTNNNKISYRFWIQKIGFANANLLPLILLHFCIQRAGLWFQKARQMSTQQT